MTEHNIEIPCNTEVVIRVSCKEVAVEVIPVVDPLPIPEPLIDLVPTPDPIEIIPVIDPVTVEPELIPLPPVIIDSPISTPVIPLSDPLPSVVEPIPVVITEIPIVEVPQLPIIEPIPVSPLVEPVPLPPIVEPTAAVDACYCDLTSKITLPDFIKQLTTLTKGLLYPSESDFPLEILTKGFSSKMPPIKGIEVRTIDRVFPNFLRFADPDDQQSGNVERAAIADRWQALYTFIKNNCSVTAWHYPIKAKRYTHELILVMLHPQGTIALKIKLVET